MCSHATLLLLVMLPAFTPSGLAGQAAALPPTTSVADLLPAPYSDPRRAVRLLDALLGLDSDDTDLLLAVTRERTALGVLCTTKDERIAHLDAAVAAARAAVARDTLSAEAHYWLAASLGQQADQQGGGTKISLAREAYDHARTAVALDPRHGGAHHVVGRLHAGAKRLSWVSRMIARGLGLGQILDQASWESAEEHLRLAVADDPDTLVHQVELGKFLLGRDRGAEGHRILEDVAGRTPRHALDAHYIDEARQVLGGVTPP